MSACSTKRFVGMLLLSATLGIVIVNSVGWGVSHLGLPGAEREAPSVPIGVELSLSPVPRLNEVGELRCVVTSVLKASGVRVEVKLPDGFALVSGDLTWEGDLAANGKVEVVASIKTVKLGSWVIEGEAGYSFTGGMYLDRDRLYVTVTEASAYMSREPPSPTTTSAVQVTTQTEIRTATTTARNETRPRPP